MTFLRVVARKLAVRPASELGTRPGFFWWRVAALGIHPGSAGNLTLR